MRNPAIGVRAMIDPIVASKCLKGGVEDVSPFRAKRSQLLPCVPFAWLLRKSAICERTGWEQEVAMAVGRRSIAEDLDYRDIDRETGGNDLGASETPKGVDGVREVELVGER